MTMHDGHRKRMRERFRKNGLDGFAHHEALELLLFYGRARGDTNALAHSLLDAGVPDAAILREDRATYTWENAQLSRGVTDDMGLTVQRAILCCRSYHARRALLYYQAAFPEAEIRVCPASVPGFNREDWYLTAEGRAMILGEVRRLGDQVNEVFDMMLEQIPLWDR